MKILGSNLEICAALERKRKILDDKATSTCIATNSIKWINRHREIVERSKQYLDELNEVITAVNVGLNIKLVPKSTFDKMIEKADFATLEFEGEYCKVALIQNYPHENFWIIYTAPIDSI